MLFCVDCDHHVYRRQRIFDDEAHLCGYEEFLDPVTGKPEKPCTIARSYENNCGKEARYFKPKGEEK